MEAEEDKNIYPGLESVKNNELCTNIIPFNLKRKGFSDISGAFPHKSSRGNLYVMVMYEYDSNYILAEPIKIGRQKQSVMHSSRSTRSSKREVTTQKFKLWKTSVLVA